MTKATATTTATATATDAELATERQRRKTEADAHMTIRHLENRALAFHPFAFDSDEALATMLADYDRLVAEQPPPPEVGSGGVTS